MDYSTQGDSNREFLNHFPAVDLPNKQYSLQADILTGWRPKNRILGPIPFNFDSPIVDQIVDELTSFGSKYKERVIYLGFRFGSSFKMHQELNRSYSFKYEGSIMSNNQHMAAYFRKFHANFKSKNNRIFKGMNPTIKPGTELVFQSNFQGGNLDTVIKIGENQYDLFIRIDTNTRGHLQWFNFSIRNCGKKKIKLNIVNFKKAKTLYQRGMKPYIYSQYLRQTKELNWFQGGDNVKYSRKRLGYEFLGEHEEEAVTFNCLSFQYSFQVDWEEVHFAYCPPFSYTDMTQMITKIKQTLYQNCSEDQSFLKQQVLCESLGGLQLPILTITDPSVDNKRKKCIVISGRIHPGESCGSFMGKGILEYICENTEQAHYLRKNLVFKVIPMLNPDGVVVGNYRTSFCGRDLNRTFKMNNDFLIPQVRALKDLVIKLKNEYKGRLLFFLDLHGHSVKKNVFLYGPEYEIWQSNYYKTRILPKIISAKTPMFRYYSCLFRVAEFKKATARAVILKNVPHCYTIQASTGFYYCPEEKRDIAFTPQKWTQMGRIIAESIKDYVQMLNEECMSKQERKLKLVSLKSSKNRGQSKRVGDKISVHKFQTRVISGSVQKGKSEELLEKPHEQEQFSKKVRQIIEAIKEDEKKQLEQREEQHDSDNFSQGGSDSQSAGEDVPEAELKSFEDQMFGYMQEYREKYYNDTEKLSRHNSIKEKKKVVQEGRQKREEKGVELIASLRKKAEQLEKTREVLVWTRNKEEFKEIKNRKQMSEAFNTRPTLSRIDAMPKLSSQILESQIMEKHNLFLGMRERVFK